MSQSISNTTDTDLVGVHYNLATIPDAPVSWLVPARVARGKFTLLEGCLGLGKFALAVDLAARVSTGAPMPGETEPAEPAGVAMFCAEDNFGDTLRPRLQAAGADLSRIFLMPHLIRGDYFEPITFPDGISALGELAQEENIRLVIVDPLLAFFGRVNCYSDQYVRRGLDPLIKLAESGRFALVGIRTWVKVAYQNLLYRGTGAMSISAAARTTLAITPEPGDPQKRRLSVLKSNLAARPKDLLFTLESAPPSIRVHWLGEAPPPIAPPDLPSVLDQACALLLRELAAGPRLATDLQDLAYQAGIGKRTLKRARVQLGVRSQFRQGRWWCRMGDSPKSESCTSGPETGQSPDRT